MSIPVIIVDDQEADRYLVRRRLSEVPEFEQIFEANAGDRFLDCYFSEESVSHASACLVLMDINMPRMNGFETVDEMQRRIDDGLSTQDVIVVMYTSSSNPLDRQRAAKQPLVKGFMVKPLDQAGIECIQSIYSRSIQERH